MQTSDDRLTAARIFALLVLYAAATLIGGAMLAGLLRLNAALGTGVLFYRGMLALAVTALVLLLLGAVTLKRARFGLKLRADDCVGAAIVAASLLSAAFTLGPVTVDRSISVFMLAQFEAAGKPLTVQDMRKRFTRIYVGDWDQMRRRVQEQEISGNLERTPQGWKLTAQGERFMKIARLMSAWSGADPRFVGR